MRTFLPVRFSILLLPSFQPIIDDSYLPEGSYINAAEMKLGSAKHQYIATQSPPKKTLARFWELASTVSLIVNLARPEELDEPGRADRYWPDVSPTEEPLWEYFGNMRVACVDSIEKAARDSKWTLQRIMVETMADAKEGSVQRETKERKNVMLLHVTDWVDYGPYPKLGKLVLEVDDILEQLKLQHDAIRNPQEKDSETKPRVLVHCR